MSDEDRKTTQVARLAIVKPEKAAAENWRRLSVSIQRQQNLVLTVWRRWHEDRGHGDALYQWMEALTAWQREKQRLQQEEAAKPAEKPETPKERRLAREAKAAVKEFLKANPKPLCPCSPLPNELGRKITAATTAAFPELPGLIRATANKILLDTWTSSPASKGTWKRWQRCLAGYGELMVFSHPQPIPIHNRHIRLIPPDSPEGDWRVGIKISRDEIDGKSVLPEDVFIVQTKGKQCRKLLGALQMLARGEGKVRGSSLVLRQGRWCLHLVYDQPIDAPPELDRSKAATLEPAIDHYVSLLIGDRDDWLFRRPRLLALHRRRLRRQCAIQREAYREGKLRKGRGRARCAAAFRNKLAGYKADLARVIAARAVRACIRAGAGVLVYRAPTEVGKAKAFLTTAGSSQHRCDTFCWHEIESQLKRNCEKAGIDLKLSSWPGPECEGSGDAKTPGTARNDGNGFPEKGSGNGAVKNGKAGAVKSGQKREGSQSGMQVKGRLGVGKHAVAKDEK